MSFINLEMQEIGLMECCGITLIKPLTWPVLQDRIHKLPNRAIAAEIWAKVEGFAGGIDVRSKSLSKS